MPISQFVIHVTFNATHWEWYFWHEKKKYQGTFPGEKSMRDASVNVNVFHEAERVLVEEMGPAGIAVLTHNQVMVEIKRLYDFHGTRP